MFDRLQEVGVLQRDFQSCKTKKDICDLCIPFQNKYGLTGKQALMIARRELTLLEISNLLDAGSQSTIDWISVKDRIPEPGQCVIGTAGGIVCEAYIDSGGYWRRGHGALWIEVFGKDRPVTHWCPLPEPPGKEAQDDEMPQV